MTYNTSIQISVIKKCHRQKQKNKSSLPTTVSLARVLNQLQKLLWERETIHTGINCSWQYQKIIMIC